eukprot:CAMPEP_0177677046 /NCGR_PEP_ID=MMETSP0447-20121125/28159_1 /TAXON_ID=0 /ORGANISM="Stygamoeba regulata, Strain BSH-02190019" /LENGTH=159 /DNA_ID=CAMNT_0019185741 /DNA_START=180 /DNA_END=659 /DNA_ORIENTATION=+
MNKEGCPTGPSFFSCQYCPEQIQGYYEAGKGVTVCQNRMQGSKEALMTTVRHELTHAYDACRVDLNPDSCAHHACTEIRASSLSGECEWGPEFMRRLALGEPMFMLRKQQQACVRRRVALSLRMAECCKGKVDQSIDEVWDVCYQDTSPFAIHPSSSGV